MKLNKYLIIISLLIAMCLALSTSLVFAETFSYQLVNPPAIQIKNVTTTQLITTPIKNIIINPTKFEPIKISEVLIVTSAEPTPIPLETIVNPKTTTRVKSITTSIKSELITENLSVRFYLQKHPELVDIISESIIETLTESPELIENPEQLVSDIEREIKSVTLVNSLNEEESLGTLGFSWKDIINQVLQCFLPSAPRITVTAIGSYMNGESTSFIVDTSGKCLSMTVISDRGLIGYVGDGRFTWPGKSENFYTEFNTLGQHYIIAYPTILENSKLKELFAAGFLVYNFNSKVGSVPILKMTKNITILSINNLTPIKLEIKNSEKLEKIQIGINKTIKSVTIKAGNITAVTTKTVEVENERLYINTSNGRKLVNIMPNVASRKAVEQTKIQYIERIELKDVGKPIYEIKGIKSGKLLGIIPVKMSIQTEIDANSGKVENIVEPWWNVLVTK